MTLVSSSVGIFVGIFVGVLVLRMPGYRSSSLTQIVSQKMINDQILVERDKSEWYQIDTKFWMEKQIDNSILPLFVELEADEETSEFISASIDKSDWLFTQLWHNVAKTFLSMFYTKTDINGMLGRGSMFVLSKGHFQTLVKNVLDLHSGTKLENMIDLGAGDGKPSEAFTTHFQNLHATEASTAMIKILKSKGFHVPPIETWHLQEQKFDLVSCLNLLDRCDTPLTVLEQIKTALKPNGIVLLAMVLPFKPYVEFSRDHQPSEKMKVKGKTFEEQAQSLADIFAENGLEVVRWTRVPYICEGDLANSIYTLDDVVFVLTHKS